MPGPGVLGAGRSQRRYLGREAPGTPGGAAGEGIRHVLPSPSAGFPRLRGGVAGGGAAARPPASAGSDRPAPASRPPRKQEAGPGPRRPGGRPTGGRGGRGFSPQRPPGAAGAGLGAWHKGEGGAGRESLATEQRSGGRRLPSPASPGEPRSGSPSRRRPPPSRPQPPRRSLPRTHPRGESAVREREGGGARQSGPPARTTPSVRGRPGASTAPSPGAVNPGSATPATPAVKWGGATKELPSASATAPLPPASPPG